MRSHSLTFNSGRGQTSANYFVAAVGSSGLGKTTGVDAATGILAVPGYLQPPPGEAEIEPFADNLPLGSGEGIAEAFMGQREEVVGETKRGEPITRRIRTMVRNNAFLVVDEGEIFNRVGERKGAIVGATLRSAWSGSTIGQANGRDDTTRIVRAGTYSLGVVAGFQPSTALPLLADTATGMAQRFAWVSAVDPTIPDDSAVGVSEEPLLLKMEALVRPGAAFPTAREGVIQFPSDVIDELRRAHLAKVRGQVVVPERDSQGPLMRCKMAALLAMLDGRVEVTIEDWRLAGMLWDTSCAVRDSVTAAADEEKVRQSEAVARARVAMAERQAAAVAGVPGKVDRLATVLAARVVEAGGLKRAEARRGLRSDDRHLFDQVAERGAALGLFRLVDGGGLLPAKEGAQ